jgi:short-subunit dehydrogenase
VTRTGFQQTAQVDRIRLVRGPTMSAESVAWAGYKALIRRQAILVPGFINAFLPFAVRLTPRSLVRWVSRLSLEQASS